MGIGFFTIADSVYESGSGKQIRILFLLNKKTVYNQSNILREYHGKLYKSKKRRDRNK